MPAMHMRLNLKQKLVVLLIGTITLSLVLAGSLLSFLQQRFFMQETVNKIYKAHSALEQNLRRYEENLLINGAEISQDESIISSVNMITEYQSIENYQPIIFDEEKKNLVTDLSEKVVLADFDLISIYDAQGELLTFAMQKDFGFLLGIVSYQQAQPVILLSGTTTRQFWTETQLPPMVKQKMRSAADKLDTIQYTRMASGFSLLVTLPIIRILPDSSVKLIGFVEITNFLGQGFVDSITQQTNMDFQLITPDRNFGSMPMAAYLDELPNQSHLLSAGHHNGGVEYVENENYFLHSHSLQLVDGRHVYFIFGRDKQALKAQLWNVQIVLLVVLLCSGLICIPLGIYISRKTISLPIQRLLEGVSALRQGSYENPIPEENDGELGALAHSFNDMGQAIKRREASLERAKGEWERTFDAINDIITIQDKQFRIILANLATCDFLAKSREEIQGKHCYELFFKRSIPCFGCPTLKALDDQKNHSAEMICEKQQSKRNLLFSSSPIFDEQGECVGIVYSAKDITDIKELENKLRQAQKMEAIGTLAGGIAHDFNNILTPILGYSEMLMESMPEGSQERADEEQVVKAASRAKELVKQILTFSRQTEHERNPVQVHLIVKEALKLMRSSMAAHVEINSHIDAAYCPVLADPTQIHQVLMNLCTNAYHAMRDSGGVLTVSLSEVDISSEDYAENLALQSGKYLKLAVSDTGHGMDKVLVEKIFNPYFTTKKKGEGTGLGLSVVHGIVSSHQGHITVYSEPGQGTEFHVYLPCIEAPTADPMGDQQEIPRGQQETVLVVDDEEPIAELLGNMLEKLDYEVIVHSNSRAALETFRQQSQGIDLVVTDMSMPNMSGAELAAELLKIRPGLPIILCTGFSEVINEEKAKAVGFSGFLLKPVLKRQLAQAATEALSGR